MDSAKSGSMGVVCMHFDLLPSLTKAETLSEEVVEKQLTLEHKFKTEATNQFLDYSTQFWQDYKNIRPSHKTRLIKIFAETDDRELSGYKPVCSLVQPMIADRLLETPLHAARFVSLIPFQRLECVGKERVEVWHSMQSFLSRVNFDLISLI